MYPDCKTTLNWNYSGKWEIRIVKLICVTKLIVVLNIEHYVCRRKREVYNLNFRKDLLDKLNDPNQFWDILKLVYKQKHVNNVTSNLSIDKWFQHFKNVFDNDVSFDYDMNDPIDNDANFNCDSRVVDDLNETISRQEIV